MRTLIYARRKVSLRACRRMGIRMVFHVYGRDENGSSFSSRAETVNVCGDGGCLILNKDVSRGSTLKLSGPNGLSFAATVQWANYDISKNVRLVGFKLVETAKDWPIRDATRGRPVLARS